MYLCEVCGAKVGPRVARMVHIIYNGKQIHREVPVCAPCKGQLDAGANLAELMKTHAKPLTPGKHLSVAASAERPRINKPAIFGKPLARGAKPKPNEAAHKPTGVST